jgi:8-oxo-dGTP pyrophosphatase MutT (NUDIX family)
MSEYVRALRAKIGRDFLLVPSAHVAARDGAGRVLLVQHVEGRWQLPGGAIEPGEDPRVAAARECHEEAGIDVRVGEIVEAFGGAEYRTTYANGDQIGFVTILYRGEIVGGTPTPDHIETQAVGWFALEETAALEMHTATRAMLRAL